MIHNIDPIIFSIGPISVRWYGLIYMSGFLIAYYFLSYALKTKRITGIEKKELDDFVFYSVLLVVIFARLFEILFYEPAYYFSNPLKMFAVWEGGLSFHGGLFGTFVSTYIFCKKKNQPLLRWADLIAVPAAMALFFGRIANFINGELYGYPVANQVTPPWYAVKFMRTDTQQLWRIPTQILESFKNLFTFLILFYLWKKAKELKLKDGFFISAFLMMYGTLRFIIEYWKDYSQDIMLGMSTGQLLCIPMFIIGAWSMWKTQKN